MILTPDAAPEATFSTGRRPTLSRAKQSGLWRAEATGRPRKASLTRSTERAAAVPVDGEGVRHQGEAHQLEQLAQPALGVSPAEPESVVEGSVDRLGVPDLSDEERRIRSAPNPYEQCKATGYEQQHVSEELDRFTSVQMLTKLERQRRNDRQYFVRNDECPLWALVDAALELWQPEEHGVDAS